MATILWPLSYVVHFTATVFTPVLYLSHLMPTILVVNVAHKDILQNILLAITVVLKLQIQYIGHVTDGHEKHWL